jgi:hypothetical protein
MLAAGGEVRRNGRARGGRHVKPDRDGRGRPRRLRVAGSGRGLGQQRRQLGREPARRRPQQQGCDAIPGHAAREGPGLLQQSCLADLRA